jgi:hypothetical protein
MFLPNKCGQGTIYQWKGYFAQTWFSDGSCDLGGAFWLANTCFMDKKEQLKNSNQLGQIWKPQV